MRRSCFSAWGVCVSGFAFAFAGLALEPIAAGEQERAGNPATDWFQRAGWGIFVHYLEGLQNNPEEIHSLGRHTSWDECVREFDCERFARAVAEVRAGYVIFTMHQITRHLIAPNATFDRLTGYRPGEACATRDLVEDLARALGARGIPLLLYWTGDGPRGDPRAAEALGFTPVVTVEYVRKWAEVAREYAERYGEKVAGWWVDGCYSWIGYDDEKLGILASALKAGNPKRIVALNPGVQDKVRPYSRHEDFTAGEQNSFSDLPPGRWTGGEQWHVLSFLGCGFQGWAQPGSKYKKRDLVEYVYEVTRLGGVVSIDVLLYRDGGLDRSQLEILKAIRPGIEALERREPVPPGNLACYRPARLLSLDGSRELPVNSEIHFARLGVDGDPATFAQAADEWPWTYEVALGKLAKVRRIAIRFAPGGYATEFDVLLSADGSAWERVATRQGHDGSKVGLEFEPREARYVRIAGRKPDGPGQPGAQMAIAELEVYE